MCNHLFVDGFGAMGDALVCCRCGLDKYPEAIPLAVVIAAAQRRIIKEDHPEYQEYVSQAKAAHAAREAREQAECRHLYFPVGNPPIGQECRLCGKFNSLADLGMATRAGAQSRYAGGWFCPICKADNPDESTPCADLEACPECGAKRPPETYHPPRQG